MSIVSSDVILNVIKRNSALQQRRRPNTGMPSFSIEKGNLSFKTTKKHSALVSDRAIDLKVKKKGSNRIHTVIGEKNPSNVRKPRTSYRTNVIKQHGFNKQAQAVIKQVAGYRPDLVFPAAKRLAVLHKAELTKARLQKKQQQE